MAKVFPLTVSSDIIGVPALPWLVYGFQLIGSGGAHTQSVQAMLVFAAKHGIKPTIEKFPLTKQGVVDAMQKLQDGKVRYRGVLINE